MKKRLIISLSLLLTFTALLGIFDYSVPDDISVFCGENLPDIPAVVFNADERNITENNGNRGVVHSKASASLFGLLKLKDVDVSIFKDISLIPGGIPFGVRISTSGVLVVGTEKVESTVGTCSPAEEAGIVPRDVILKVGEKQVNTSEELTKAIEESNGDPLKILYTRDGNERETTLYPVCGKDGKQKAGLWVRDSTAGIGTVTYVVPSTGAFGGLGHGICDSSTGELLPMLHGTVTDVAICGINRGDIGSPGEIRGVLGNEKTGNLTSNTDCGVFGIFLRTPTSLTDSPIHIALSDSVHVGEAEIICTLEDGKRERYKIRIGKVDKNSRNGKNFVIEVIDPALLEKTGGIVQGMSGSPIIQDGRLIGAVTHVLISDPKKGYGILIEKMMSEMSDLLL